MTSMRHSGIKGSPCDRENIKDLAIMHLEDQPNHTMSEEDADFLANFPEEGKKKALRKVRYF